MKQSRVLSKLLMPILVFLACFAPLPALAAPTELYVSPSGSDANGGTSWAEAKLTIDGAISAASSGYTIWVTNGTYGAVTESVNEMSLQSVNGPEVTIIDAEGSGRCVQDVYHGSLAGFTLKNGVSMDDGGAANISYSEISNCIIQSNTASGGGGLYLYYSTVSVCRIENNTANDDGGGLILEEGEAVNCSINNNIANQSAGGAYLYRSTMRDSQIAGNNSTEYAGGVFMESLVVLSNCVIRGNSSGQDGGGAYLYESTINNSQIMGNNSAQDGGGVYMESSEANMCIVSNNHSLGAGGGVYMYEGTLRDSSVDYNQANNAGGVYAYYDSVIMSCFVRYNVATGYAGGILATDAAIIRNSLIAGNQADTYSGGVYMYSEVTLDSSTVVGNSAGVISGGIFIEDSESSVSNSIAYFNQGSDILVSEFTEASLSHSCRGVLVGDASGPGSITNNPLFANAGSGYGTNHIAGDYRLQSSSPCVNTGTNEEWMVGAKDLAGTNRILNGIVNMGAYEATGAAKISQTITFPAIANQSISSRIGLAATASSGLPVAFSVASGAASISGGTNVSFSAAGTVTIRASQAGNETYEAAPDVDRSFYVVGNSFAFRAVALQTSVVLRWTDPFAAGFSNQTAMVRFSTTAYPTATNVGTEIFRNTNQVYTHTGLTPGQPYYYTIWCSQDGVTFVPPPYDTPPLPNGQVTVFWYSTLGETAYWRLDTNGVFNEGGDILSAPLDPSAWIFGGFGDINNDRRPEIFWLPTNANTETWFLDANYQYSSNAVLYPTPCPATYQLRCAGDVRGDGIDALFFQNLQLNTYDAWHVNTDGTEGNAYPVHMAPISGDWQLRDCGDVNGDGRVELFFHNTNSGAAETWFMDTNGQQTAMLSMYTNIVPASEGWSMVCAGDVSGDGLSEVFWQNTNGIAAIWFLNTNGFRSAGYRVTFTPVAEGWRMVDTADVNGDGRVELLWHHTDGSTMVWFLNPDGTFARQQEMNSAPMASRWRMMGAFTAPPALAGPP